MVWGNQKTFVQQWQFAQLRNCINEKLVECIIKASRREYRITRKAEKFLNDLNAEIEQGCTEYVSSAPQEERFMPRGFGGSQPQRRNGKTLLKEVQPMKETAQNLVQEKRDLAMQARWKLSLPSISRSIPKMLL